MVLRCWEASDAPRFKSALDQSLPELQKWIPWTLHEPSELAEIEARLQGYRDDFFAARDALFGMFDLREAEVLGGVGIYRRVGPGAVEIGYWTRSDRAGEGLATEATGAVVERAKLLTGVERIEIRCDPANAPSMAIPSRLGFRRGEVILSEAPSPATGSRELVVWELSLASDPADV